MIDHDRQLYIRDGGYFEVKVGTLTFLIGKDPSETDRVTYDLHWGSFQYARMLGVNCLKHWRTVASFRTEMAKAVRTWCRTNLKIIEKENLL